MTFASLGIVGVLVVCPRGFVNERGVWPIPDWAEGDAKKCVALSNPDDDVRLTRYCALADADDNDVQSANARLVNLARDGMGEKGYETELYFSGPLAHDE